MDWSCDLFFELSCAGDSDAAGPGELAVCFECLELAVWSSPALLPPPLSLDERLDLVLLRSVVPAASGGFALARSRSGAETQL